MRLIHIFLIKQLLNTLLFDYRCFLDREERLVWSKEFEMTRLRRRLKTPSPPTPSPSNRFIGGHSEEDPPVPIPNTEVKLFCADGTAWVTVWESRSPPISFSFKTKSPVEFNLFGAFLRLTARLCRIAEPSTYLSR